MFVNFTFGPLDESNFLFTRGFLKNKVTFQSHCNFAMTVFLNFFLNSPNWTIKLGRMGVVVANEDICRG